MREVRLRLRRCSSCTVHLRRDLRVQGNLPLRERLWVRDSAVATLASGWTTGRVDSTRPVARVTMMTERHLMTEPASQPTAEVAKVLVASHREFLAFVERRVGDRALAGKFGSPRCFATPASANGPLT